VTALPFLAVLVLVPALMAVVLRRSRPPAAAARHRLDSRL
jgi:hypothetical protein